MTIAFVNAASNKVSVGNVTLNTTGGNIIVAFVTSNPGATTSGITDTVGTNYVLVQSELNTVQVDAFIGLAAGTNASNVITPVNGAAKWTICVAQYSGASTTVGTINVSTGSTSPANVSVVTSE